MHERTNQQERIKGMTKEVGGKPGGILETKRKKNVWKWNMSVMLNAVEG